MKHAESNWLNRFAVLTACVTFLLIIAGALVVGHDAGLSVPDWPLSYGQFFPRMEGNIFYEHGHRLIAGLVGILTMVLAVWLWSAERRAWVRWLGIAAVLAVVAQAVLGGITVLYLLPVPVLILHACLAQLFFCGTVSLAVVTGRAWNEGAAEPSSTTRSLGGETFPLFRHLSLATTVAIYIQLILGAARRHKALGLLPHIIWAVVVALLILSVAFVALNRLPKNQSTLRLLPATAALFVVVQLALGYGSYWTRMTTASAPQPESSMILVTTAHVAGGALLLAISLIVTLLAYRRFPSSGAALSFNRDPQKTPA